MPSMTALPIAPIRVTRDVIEDWAEQRAELIDLAKELEPARLRVGDAAALLQIVAGIENLAAAAKARLAARVAEAETWRIAGAKGPAEHLARETGVSVQAATDILATGQTLEELPELQSAATAGRLSAVQTTVIAGAASVAPESTRELLDAAREGSLRELRELSERIRAAADPDPEATRTRIHRNRGLWVRRQGDGADVLTWRDNPERIALARASLAQYRNELFDEARRLGRHEPSAALDADALYTALTHSTSTDLPTRSPELDESAPAASRAERRGRRRATRVRRGPYGATQVIVRVEQAALGRGRAAPGELCEIAGSGPVAVSAVHELAVRGARVAIVTTEGSRVVDVAHVPATESATLDLADPTAINDALVRHGRRVEGVAHPGRRPTAHQLTALRWISPTCSVRGCSNLYCEIDHNTGWAITRDTRLEDLDRLCSFHHDQKTRFGWWLEPGRGKRRFLPPRVPQVQPQPP